MSHYQAAARAKRRPLLVDDYLASNHVPVIPRAREDALRSRLRDAKKFVFDASATRYAGDMMRWHRAPHKRGKVEKGVVVTDYDVVK